MNIETANRLYELRKKNGYSQEELAEKLGLSRQAVSKWERAEASPDTDNLIELAKLYGVTLDELVNTKPAQEFVEENKVDEPLEDKNLTNDINMSRGIHLVDEDGSQVHIVGNKVIAIDKDNNVVEKKKTKGKRIEELLTSLTVFASLIAYLVLGFVLDNAMGWICYWVLFLFIPIVSTLCEAIRKKRASNFAYPVLVTAVYCFMGLRFQGYTYSFLGKEYTQMWHPFWILFLTIPVYYIIANAIDRLVHKDAYDEDNEDEDED